MTGTKPTAPDILVTCATIGRPESLERLIISLDQEVQRSGYKGRVGLLVVHNEPRPRRPGRAKRGEIVVHHADVRDAQRHLDEASRAGVLPAPSQGPPWSIGHAREAQVALVRKHLDEAIPDLPHSSVAPFVTWMVDDDVSFSWPPELVEGRGAPGPLWRAAQLWADLPGHTVVLGTFVGDPPIPGPDTWRGQLTDISARLSRMLELGPESVWDAPMRERSADDYYDFAEGRPGHEVPAFFLPGDRAPVREVALTLLESLPGLLDGRQLTRPLIWDGSSTSPKPSLRRGGNALFLDVESLFRWPTPVFRGLDGIDSRRSDTLWATLAHHDAPGLVVEATLPLLHGREGQVGSTRRTPDGTTLAHHATAQARGVAMARALLHGTAVADELAARREQVLEQRAAVGAGAEGVVDLLGQLERWGDPAVNSAIGDAQDVVRDLAHRALQSVPESGHEDAMQAFVDQLPAATARWRACW
jgi:hypothetical protein